MKNKRIDDIEKLVNNSHKTSKELLKRVNEELKEIRELDIGLRDSIEREKILLEAKTILLEKIEEEQDEKELKKIKNNKILDNKIKEEIKEELFNNIKYYFKKFEDKKSVYDTLIEEKTIDLIIEDIADIFGKEFEDYIFSIYPSTLNQVYNIYKPYIKMKEREEREQARYYRQKKINRNKKIIGTNMAILGILKWAETKKRR